MTKVSIIIPVYNTEQYLSQCLDSVINQTFRDIEIIVVNDASTDNSLSVIKEYQQKDNRIVLINVTDNCGLSNSRNLGIKKAKSPYITFVDSDDWIRKDYIEFLFNNIEKFKCDAFSGSYYVYNNKTSQYETRKYSFLTTKHKNNKNLIVLPSINCSPWCKIYNKDFLLKNNLFFRLRRREDSLFLYDLVIHKARIIYVNEPIYFYRVNRKNSLTSSNYFILHDVIFLLKEIRKTLYKENLFGDYFRVFYIYSFIFLSFALICSNIPQKRIQKMLIAAKTFLFCNSEEYTNCIDKFAIAIFKFFINHVSLYINTAKILKKIKRAFEKYVV
ncbi:glycosyltransferase family 2 protein [Candidatus Ruminimicrobiellum ovillum]|uniref:glycosyltransferase family 2 protein n=1 Tax=Candidatus Ruminimicrobiellum ovillum TaxID=1947927 RepID=UPI00355A4C25